MMEINPKNAKVWSMLGQRATAMLAMLELAETADNLVVVTADLVLDRFKKTCPEKLINTGIAEQNMIGVAAGLAKEGMFVIATTYAHFLSMRCYEQVRVNLGDMGFPVHLVGVNSGVAMGSLGNTHYAVEDLAIMRAIPGLTVLSPADGAEAVKVMLALKGYGKPTYVRLTGLPNTPIVYTEDYEFVIGKSVCLREGTDVTIVATGSMVSESLGAARLLEESGISAAVVNMHTIKPLDTAAIDRACQVSTLIVTVEEHRVAGGLGGAVAEHKSSLRNAPPQLSLGFPEKFESVGEYRFMLQKHGLTAEQIAKSIQASKSRMVSR